MAMERVGRRHVRDEQPVLGARPGRPPIDLEPLVGPWAQDGVEESEPLTFEYKVYWFLLCEHLADLLADHQHHVIGGCAAVIRPKLEQVSDLPERAVSVIDDAPVGYVTRPEDIAGRTQPRLPHATNESQLVIDVTDARTERQPGEREGRDAREAHGAQRSVARSDQVGPHRRHDAGADEDREQQTERGHRPVPFLGEGATHHEPRAHARNQ
jgi:hypothetical protein